MMANVKTTNDMTNFETGAVRDTGGKGRMDLLPMCAILRISKHMEDALSHYPERNWEAGLPMHTMIDSAMRHLVKYMDGMTDEDHLCAAATNLLMALWTEEKKPEMQDIPSRLQKCVDTSGGLPGQMSFDDLVVMTGPCDKWDMGRCLGTKEMLPCSCRADKSECDFYPTAVPKSLVNTVG